MKYAILFLLLVCGCVEAPTATPNISAPSQPEVQPVDPWGGLDVETAGAPLESSTQVVVLLHGYGASGTDLVPFSEHLAAEGRAFVFPAAPVELDSGGLAWATTDSEIGSSLQSLQSLVAFIHETYPDSKISVGGFSQGASMSSMLVDSATPIQHLILFSPGLFLKNVAKKSDKGPEVYISHGKQDDVLPFSDAQKLKRVLSYAGFDVKLTAFDGGHAIPTQALVGAKAQLDGK